MACRVSFLVMACRADNLVRGYVLDRVIGAATADIIKRQP
jgi:hypothetical protein